MFDEIPEDKQESNLCPKCNSGSVTLQPNLKWWECDECDFAKEVLVKNKDGDWV